MSALAFLPDAATLAAFVVACLALNFTPAADMMFSVASGASVLSDLYVSSINSTRKS